MNDDENSAEVTSTTILSSSSAPTPPPPQCLGTRQLQILHHKTSYTVASPGVVAAYRSVDQGISDDGETARPDHYLLQVQVTNGMLTFTTRVDPNDTNVPWEATSTQEQHARLSSNKIDRGGDAYKVDLLASYLLNDSDADNADNSIMVSCELLANDNGHAASSKVKLSIREKLADGRVRILWSGQLLPGQAQLGDLEFSRMLGDSLNHKMEEIASLENQKADLLQWKDTAEKLDGEWQKDKDSMLERFLILYRKTHGELRKALDEIDELKKRPPRASAAEASAVASRRPSSTASAPFDFSVARDVDTYDQDTIDRLARGERQRKPQAATNASTSTSSTGDDVDVDAPYSAPSRLNPVSGAHEIWNIDDMLDEQQREENEAADAPDF